MLFTLVFKNFVRVHVLFFVSLIIFVSFL